MFNFVSLFSFVGFGMYVKLVTLLKISFNKTYFKFQEGKHLSDILLNQNGLLIC